MIAIVRKTERTSSNLAMMYHQLWMYSTVYIYCAIFTEIRSLPLPQTIDDYTYLTLLIALFCLSII